MLKQRIITAVVLIALAIGGLFFLSPARFCIALAVISLAASWEWTNLMRLQRIAPRVLYLLIMLGVFYNALFIPVPLILMLSALFWLLAIICVALYPRGSGFFAKNVYLRGLLGIIIITPCWVALNFIRNLNDGIFAILFLFVLIWGSDTVAYFAGKRFGKHKLAPQVSPGKSVEGVAAALFFAVLFTVAALWIIDVAHTSWIYLLVLSLLTAFFSVVGDLFESILKRQVGLKDSGRLLPGHGGLLDRIDSLTAAAPIFALGAFLLSV